MYVLFIFRFCGQQYQFRMHGFQEINQFQFEFLKFFVIFGFSTRNKWNEGYLYAPPFFDMHQLRRSATDVYLHLSINCHCRPLIGALLPGNLQLFVHNRNLESIIYINGETSNKKIYPKVFVFESSLFKEKFRISTNAW